MPATNLPNGINVVDNSTIDDADGKVFCENLQVDGSAIIAEGLTITEGLDVSGGLTVSGTFDMNGAIEGQTISLVPTSSGNSISVQPAADSAGNQFIYVGNSGGTGSAGHSCGFITGSFNGGEIGLISNGDDVTYNGIAINSLGIYLANKNFSINMNEGSGSTYTTALAISNSATGGVDILGSSDGNAAPAGFVGERFFNVQNNDSALNVPNVTWTDIISISLSAGNWLVSGMVGFDVTGVTSGSLELSGAFSTTAGNSSEGLTPGLNENDFIVSSIGSDFSLVNLPIPPFLFTLSASATMHLKAYGTFSGSLEAYGSIHAVRMP